MALARHCHSGKLAAVAPGDTTPAATKRRLERTLANDRLDPETAWPQLARAVLAGWAGGPIVLILDETLNRNDLRCLKLTLAYRKRALPIRSVCYAPGGQPGPMPALIGRLLREVAGQSGGKPFHGDQGTNGLFDRPVAEEVLHGIID